MVLFRNKNINKLLIISIFLFSIKWILSYYYFNEYLSVRIIFESVGDGYYWYPYIKYLAFLDFNNSFDPYINNLKSVPVPVGSLIFHALLFKIFNFAGIIIIEFFAIFIFLFIFYKIFSNFFTNNESVFLSLFIFMIPVLIKITNIESLPYLSTFDNNFFSLRPHRPIVANLYFYSFIYLLTSIDNDLILKKKKIISLALILGLSFSSFYYFFLIEFFALLFFLIYKFKIKVTKELFNNYKNILFAILIFIISIAPFIINLIYNESDSIERAGLFSLTIEKKGILINYYLSQYFSLKFLFILFLSIICIFFSNKRNIINVRLLNIFFIIFVSCIVSPIFFILVSPKSGLLYHFNNTIVVWAYIFFIIFSITLIKNYLKLNLKLLLNNILIILFIIIYFFNFYFEKNKQFNDQVYKNRRIEFQKITEKLNNNKNILLKNSALLTFDNELMIWSILNGVKYLNLINGMWVPKTNDMIENDLINNFKFLNLNEKDFISFLKNEKKGWRYFNPNVGNFFHYRYTANSLNTFNGSKNFEANIKKFILSTSPMRSQQIAIPNEEFNRLKIKFYEYQSINFRKPEIIVLEKLKPITNKIVIKKENYCKLYDGDIYILYLKKDSEINCEL